LVTITDEQELKREIVESKKILEDKLSGIINYFTFPNGLYNDSLCQTAREAGYKYVLATEERLSGKESVNNKNFIFHRMQMDKKTWQENVFKLNYFHQLFGL
jgi:peptidoglycan/xylan/chitin deacetylase (PgdA/CDA1 family)